MMVPISGDAVKRKPKPKAPPKTAARIIAESRGDWLFDPAFDGWSVRQ